MPKIGIIILAAGSSSRMGKPKQLLPLGKGSMLSHVVQESLKSHAAEVICVLGANSTLIQSEINSSAVRVLINDSWQHGLGTSIACAVEHCEHLDALLITLGDQPLVDTEYLNDMIREFRSNNDKIIATSYDGRPGVPALFPKAYFKDLQQLTGDQGAKTILKQNAPDIIILEANDKTFDVDTEADYNQLKAGSKTS
ncbi:nucleotidyltransferase family protein [Fulvivirga ligni]|uniref:nucleotidyltransferase family protein n=1 Tax=Fulvivirga ligni TaxID=2904246 RepID=UPI001F1EE4A9|nr:nucleotidyltransferase family protein [Fulvivirga ligni]UII19482.1 nucleotidyltransferase family protein [Fulvivirga ligni]